MFKEQKGVTLIALVITIIVLLILAGVSIAFLTGENGILNKSTKAAAEQKVAEAKELATTEVVTQYTTYLEGKYTNSSSAQNNADKFAAKANTTNTDKYLITAGVQNGPNAGTIEIKPFGKNDAGEDIKWTGTIGLDGSITWNKADVE